MRARTSAHVVALSFACFAATPQARAARLPLRSPLRQAQLAVLEKNRTTGGHLTPEEHELLNTLEPELLELLRTGKVERPLDAQDLAVLQHEVGPFAAFDSDRLREQLRFNGNTAEEIQTKLTAVSRLSRGQTPLPSSAPRLGSKALGRLSASLQMRLSALRTLEVSSDPDGVSIRSVSEGASDELRALAAAATTAAQRDPRREAIFEHLVEQALAAAGHPPRLGDGTLNVMDLSLGALAQLAKVADLNLSAKGPKVDLQARLDAFGEALTNAKPDGLASDFLIEGRVPPRESSRGVLARALAPYAAETVARVLGYNLLDEATILKRLVGLELLKAGEAPPDNIWKVRGAFAREPGQRLGPLDGARFAALERLATQWASAGAAAKDELHAGVLRANTHAQAFDDLVANALKARGLQRPAALGAPELQRLADLANAQFRLTGSKATVAAAH